MGLLVSVTVTGARVGAGRHGLVLGSNSDGVLVVARGDGGVAKLSEAGGDVRSLLDVLRLDGGGFGISSVARVVTVAIGSGGGGGSADEDDSVAHREVFIKLLRY
jgi:hypothetical protein